MYESKVKAAVQKNYQWDSSLNLVSRQLKLHNVLFLFYLIFPVIFKVLWKLELNSFVVIKLVILDQFYQIFMKPMSFNEALSLRCFGMIFKIGQSIESVMNSLREF